MESKEQFGSTKAVVGLLVEKESYKSQESNTPVEENKEAMLSEDGVPLRYILKADQRERTVESVCFEHEVYCDEAASATAMIHDTDFCYTAENSPTYNRSRDVQDDVVKSIYSTEKYQCEFGESSQKLHRKDNKAIPTTSSSTRNIADSEDILEEEIMNLELRMQSSMVERLTKAVKNMEQEFQQDDNLKVPEIDLMIRIQVVLDENNLFPENNSIDILYIISTIADKTAAAWTEKLEGYTEANSNETKALMKLLTKESNVKEQEPKQRAKDVWVT